MNRNTLIKWTGIGVFTLMGIAMMMSIFLGPCPTAMLCIAVASFGLLVLVCEILFFYVIFPPIKDNNNDDTHNN